MTTRKGCHLTMMKEHTTLSQYRTSTMLATGGHVTAVLTHCQYRPDFAGQLMIRVEDPDSCFGSLDRPEFMPAGSTIWNAHLKFAHASAISTTPR